MESLTGATIAQLTIYDMLKPIDEFGDRICQAFNKERRHEGLLRKQTSP